MFVCVGKTIQPREMAFLLVVKHTIFLYMAWQYFMAILALTHICCNSVVVRIISASVVTSQYLVVATVGSRKKHLVLNSLTCVHGDILKKGGMENEADVLTLWSFLLQLSKGVKP